MSYYKIRSYAKINLALNVIGKSSSLHRIESLVSFLDLNDEIYIKKLKQNHEINSSEDLLMELILKILLARY